MQQAVHRLAAINDDTAGSEDAPGDSHGDSLKEVVVLSTAHSWNPQKLVGRAAAADAWTETGESRPLMSQQSSPQQPLRTQASQQLPNHSPMKAAAGRTKPTVHRTFLTVLACLSWVAASSGAILVNKHIMVDLHFPYPGTVGAIGMIGTSVIAAAVRILGLVPATQKVSIKFLTTQVMPTGLFLALAMQLGNTAYLHLSVAFVQMLKAFTPVCTMLFAFLFQLEHPSASLIAAVIMIATGVTTASYAEGNLSWAGVAAMVASMLCEGLRLVMMQSMIAKRNFHPLEALLYLAPAASFWMLLFAGFTEVIHIHQDQHLTNLTDHPMYIAASAAAGFGVNAMAMAVISLASALTLKILGICKDVGLVLYGVAVLGEHVTRLQFSGYSISILGLIWYNSIKMFGPSATAPSSSARRSSVSVRVDDSSSQGGGSNRSVGGVKQSAFAKPSAFAKVVNS